MDLESQLSGLLDLAEQLGLEVRRAYLGGEGGALCVLRGRGVLFVDIAAGLADQVAQTAGALSRVPEIEDLYVVPEVRDLLETYGERGEW